MTDLVSKEELEEIFLLNFGILPNSNESLEDMHRDYKKNKDEKYVIKAYIYCRKNNIKLPQWWWDFSIEKEVRKLEEEKKETGSKKS